MRLMDAFAILVPCSFTKIYSDECFRPVVFFNRLKELKIIQEWKLSNFFLNVTTRKNKELFTPTWNEIVVSVYYKQNKTMQNEETRRKWLDSSVPSLQHARVNKLIIYITMHKQKPLIYKLSRRKTPNKANLGLQAYEKNQWTFFMVPHRLRL